MEREVSGGRRRRGVRGAGCGWFLFWGREDTDRQVGEEVENVRRFFFLAVERGLFQAIFFVRGFSSCAELYDVGWKSLIEPGYLPLVFGGIEKKSEGGCGWEDVSIARGGGGTRSNHHDVRFPFNSRDYMAFERARKQRKFVELFCFREG